MSGVDKPSDAPIVHSPFTYQAPQSAPSQDSINSPRSSFRGTDALLVPGETPLSRTGDDIPRTERTPKALTVHTPPWVPGKVRVMAPRNNTYPFTEPDPRLSAYANLMKEGQMNTAAESDLSNQELVSPASGTWDWLWPNMPNRMPPPGSLCPDVAYTLPPQGIQSTTELPAWPPSYKGYPVDAKEAAMPVTALHDHPLGFHGAYRKPESHASVAVGSDRNVQEISTLFMAGFPEDITDREFSNLFLFAKGFEASMLKYPQPTKSEDDIRKMGDRHGPWPPIDREGKASPSQREPEPSSGKSKQIIGFAKFSTREEALQARDVLNGFRIDPDRGCILKAELAKKNLHTKRTMPFVVTKHGHPAGHAKLPPSARDFAMGESAPASALSTRRSGSFAGHIPDMTSEDHAPLPPVGLHPMIDTRNSAAAWAEAMEQKQVQLALESHGMATMTPISEMVGRLENFSKTIPTFAGQHAATVPTLSESTTAQWTRANTSPALLSSAQGAPSHADRLRSGMALTPRDVAQSMQDMSLTGASRNLYKSPESTMLQPARDSSGNSSNLDGTSSLSGLTQANSCTSGSEIWSMGSHPCASPNQVNLDDYLPPSVEQRQASSAQDRPPSQESAETRSKPPLTWDFDLNAVTDLEQQPYTDGFQEGHAKGQFFGRLEGRALGREKGFELWSELGYYTGVVHMYLQKLEGRASESHTRKAQKQVQQIQQFLQLCEQMPRENNASAEQSYDDAIDGERPDLEKLLERIRAKYRLLCKSLGFEERTGSEHLDGIEGAAPAKAEKFVQIAGQLVDVNQLKY